MGRDSENSSEGLSQWVRLVASIAHSATTVEEALSWTLKMVCEYTGWPLGHILLLGPDRRSLECSGIWYDADPVGHAPFVQISMETV